MSCLIGQKVPRCNGDEAPRTLDALKHPEEHGEVCPVHPMAGEEAVEPTAEGVAGYLNKHMKAAA